MTANNTTEPTYGHKDLLSLGYSELTHVTRKGKERDHSGVYAKLTGTSLELAFYDGDNFSPVGDSMRTVAWVGGYEFALANGEKAVLTSFSVKVLGLSGSTFKAGDVHNANIRPIAKNAYSVRVDLAASKQHVSASSGKVYASFAHNQTLRGSNAVWCLYLDTGKVIPQVKPVTTSTTKTFNPTPVAPVAPAKPAPVAAPAKSAKPAPVAPVAPVAAPVMSAEEKLAIVDALAGIWAKHPSLTKSQVMELAPEVNLI